MTTPGELRHRVTIQTRPTNLDGTLSKDSYGQAIQDWIDVATVWADITPADGQERDEAGAMVAGKAYRVVVRYRSWITSAHRLVYAGQALEIQSVVDVDERHFWTELVCAAGMTQG